MEDGKPLNAKEKRQEQIKRWENSATDLECASYTNPKVRVKFDDGAVFLAACSAGDLDEVKALLKGGADINFANVDGLTALHQACIDGNLTVVQFLVEHGSGIDQEDNEGWTPLHATASCGFMDIVKYLVKKGANVGAVNSEAELPIDIAEDDEMTEFLQSEIDRQGIDVDAAKDIERMVMLEHANDLLNKYQNGEEKSVVYRHSKSGATALHIAAAKGYNDVMKILMKAGVDINARDNDGWTPLHAASHWSQENSAKILADKGANFKTRSKLGQTPFDVADEDMLEYLQELEEKQEENVKDEPIIEPPPFKKDRRSSPALFRSLPAKDSSNILMINEIQNGEKPSKKIIDESPEESSSEEDDQDVPAPVTRFTSPPPRSSARDTKCTSREKDRSSALTNDHSTEDVSDRYTSRRNRPSSLNITSPQEQPQHRPLAMTYSEGGSSKPPIANQAVTRNRENGGRAPTSARDVKEDSPLSWRTGLRKTGSFDDKSKTTILNSKSEVERSSSYTRFSDATKPENTSSGVAPVIDARKTKAETETENEEFLSGYQRSTSFRRRKGTDSVSAITTTDTDTTPFKRSISYKKAVGRTESLEHSDGIPEPLSTRRLKLFSNVFESPSEITTQGNDTAEAAKFEDPERRRSHLQPVRDEEAEAQRRIRSRRERQTRRSTQGVTLDVVEEAIRTIGQMKQKQPAADKMSNDASTDSAKSRNDLSSSLRRVDDSQQASSSSSQSAGTPVTSLPSGYIPSDQRVKVNDTSDSKSAGLSVPSITFDTSPTEDDVDAGDGSTAENGNSAVQNRKSAAQQRRRTRKERRSTGLPDLKPSSSATETVPAEKEEFSTGTSIDGRIVSDSPRFRRRRLHSRGENRSRPKLPDQFQTSSVYKTKTEGSIRRPISERIKKMVQDVENLDDDERHRKLVERLSSRIRKKNPDFQSIPDEASKSVALVDDKPTAQQENVQLESSPTAKKDTTLASEEDEPRFAMELDEPPIPTMRRRLPPRSNLVAMFAADNMSSQDTFLEKSVNKKNPRGGRESQFSTPKAYPKSDQHTAPIRSSDYVPEILLKSTDVLDRDSSSDPGIFSQIIAACVVLCAVFLVGFYLIL